MSCAVLVAGCRPHGVEALRRGDEALRAGRTGEAIALLEQAATDLPTEARVWNHLGLAYHAAGRDAEALKSHLRALDRNRGFLEAWYNVGLLHYEQGNWLEAERALRTYLGAETTRTNAVAWRTLGLAQFESNQLELAERSLSTATKLAPRDAEAWNGVGLTQVARRRFRDALKTFAYVAEIAPGHAPARLNAAVVTHQHLGDRKGAIPLYRAYLALNPPDSTAVETIINQLELSLRPAPATNVPPALVATNPAPRLATNLVSRATNTPAKPATNPPAQVARATNPSPQPIVRTNPAAAVPPPKLSAPATSKRPEPEPEVVRLEAEPRLAVARDVKPAPPVVTNVPNAPASPATEATNSPPTAATAVPVDPTPTGETFESDPDRPGFWRRVNPAKWNWRRANPGTWFGSAEPGTTNRTTTPLNQSTAARPPARGTLALPTNAPAVAAAPIPKPRPVVPRYTRQVTATPSAGNRLKAEQTFNEAILVHNRRDLAGAATLYEQAAQADPTFYPAHHNLALTALDLNDPTRALAAAESATVLQPAAVASRQLFATALQRANYPADAAEQLEQILAAKPSDTQSHLTVAGLYAGSLADPAKARPHYLKVLELDPNHPQASAIRIWLAGNP